MKKQNPSVEEIRSFAKHVRDLFSQGYKGDEFENQVSLIEKKLGFSYEVFQDNSDLNDPLQWEWIEE